ncbi:Beta-lactamase [Pseudooceanicola batsensis HTCC2597]|uniref:Beta-lactamase n=1 Tax=Pseudooceanicola batsensis (strain ATCC BAA-863 / DSM 15984 / KCTC 12145 / HTCC2597) TaxID=252305 RepID=A3TSQ6_PSEBH|nr:EstA family serine hydrolase [Pseudooceanicola batsensis]EAQ04683.1 Beta-lactamase [Pseudooceanicola batsensis HTCC2597]
MDMLPVTEALTQPLSAAITGEVHLDYTCIAHAFAANFAERGELGASLCVTVGGRRVVDLWGGVTEPDGPAWQRDTVGVVFSCTKAATALCLHVLAACGEIELDAPVARYWPEFAGQGKDAITLRMLLDHSAGLPALRAPLKPDCLQDWDYMVSHLEAETAFWAPGSQVGYHAVTFGFLVGEVVRRVSGRSLGAFFRDEIARPLGLDFAIGLPEEDEPRVAPVVPYRPSREEQGMPFLRAAMEEGTIPNLFVFNSGDWAVKGVNTRAGRATEIGAANGVTNARGLAGLFAALAAGGEALGLDPVTVESFAQANSATHHDATLQAPTRFGPGFMLAMGRRPTPVGEEGLVIGPRAFGHVGMGGSVGFADPDRGLAFGYTMNRLGGGLLLNERGQSLIDATYGCLGATEDRHGFWS